MSLRAAVDPTDDMPKSQITIRQANPATERSQVLRLLKENLPEATAEGRFDWAYLDNPEGAALVWLAETADGEAVATSAAFPRQFRIQGDTLRALVLSDFAVDRRYRTLGPAVALLRATLAAVDEGPFEFALDHPSESMSAVYRRLGGIELGPLTRYVRLLNAKAAATRRWGPGLTASVVGSLGDFAIRTLDQFRRVSGRLIVETSSGGIDEDFAELGRVLEERRAVCGARHPDYINWRYRSGIRFEYSTVTLRTGNEPLAYAILQHTGPSIITVVEFVCPEDNAIEVALFGALLDVSRRSDVDSVQASCIQGGAWCKILERLGFAAREQSTGPVVYSPKNAKWTDILTDKDQWWMTDGDRDG